ncbi:uncharacterized protein BJ212DRAFT_1477208 [Suillus subaureus]|uniref:Uncharacterized protein n=1 Tax=Suillus subaureus TaxID=48587 RepID=A0A9P7EJK7_9AGAM|nr:uncharacterized protein BJ212DRAFT_1477208 [Suillus subaureus]KAG1822801.1 hypothetical protein BJ212DRAFT_1477208 [Suillus subaureus]
MNSTLNQGDSRPGEALTVPRGGWTDKLYGPAIKQILSDYINEPDPDTIEDILRHPNSQDYMLSCKGEFYDKAVDPAPPAQTTTVLPSSASVQPKASKDRAPEITTSSTHPPRDRKQRPSNAFSSFSFLTSKRNRTTSGSSLDARMWWKHNGTYDFLVVGCRVSSWFTLPAHSTVNQVQPLPPMMPPPSRDSVVAARVTFDVEEDPPDPHPGATGKQKGTRLVGAKLAFCDSQTSLLPDLADA